jgi:exodeoxyribonuclease VII large subunit
MRDLIARRGQRVDELVFRLAEAQRRYLRQFARRLEIAHARVRAQDLRNKTSAMRRDVQAQTEALAAVTRNLLLRRSARLEQLAGRLNALSPVAILERGYALVFDGSGQLVKDAGILNPGDIVRTRVAHGEFESEIKKIK